MAATGPFAHPGNAGAAMQEDPHATKRMLEDRLRQVEEMISRNLGDRDAYNATPMGLKGTPTSPPLEEESGQPSFMTEVYEHLERSGIAVAALAEEIHRLRATIATERSDRRQEQERVLKILGGLIETARSPFPDRNPTNVPARW